MGQLNAVNREHLASVCCGWENRLYGVLRHSFYLGYRYALAVVEETEPASVTGKMTSKILLAEQELGFTSTVEDRDY